MESETVDARDCADLLMRSIHPLMHTMRDAMRQLRLGEGDAPTMEQYRMMQMLSRHSPNLRELATRHAVTPSTMSRSIDLVVQRGWVTRTPAPDDRRQVVIALSEEGRAIHDAMMDQVREHLVARLSALDSADRARLYDALRTIGAILPAAFPHHDDECQPQANNPDQTEQTS